MTLRAEQIERVGNGLAKTTLVAVSPYSILRSDVSLLVDTSVPRTLQLPTPATKWQGNVWDISGQAAVNVITLKRAAGEKINGVAADYPLNVSGNTWFVSTDGTDWYVTQLANVQQIGPTATNVVNTSSATTTSLFSITIADNTTYRIYLYVEAADAAGNKAEWISYVTYYRINGGPVTLLGTDKGPAPVSTIPTSLLAGNWIIGTIVLSTLGFSLVTLSATHLTCNAMLFVIPIPQGLPP